MTLLPSSSSYSGKNLDLYVEKQKLHVNLNAMQLKALELTPDHSVLDLGCSNGFFSRQISPFVKRVQGVDLADSAVGSAIAANEGYTNIEYRIDDATTYLAEGEFDRIILSMVLLAIPTAESMRRIFSNSSRNLKRGGLLVFSDISPAIIASGNWYDVRTNKLPDSFDIGIPGAVYRTSVHVLAESWLEIDNVSWFSLYASEFWNEFGFTLTRTIGVPFHIPEFLRQQEVSADEYQIWVLRKE